MPKIVMLGSCRYEPYKMLIMPNKLDPELYARDHEKAYEHACDKFYPAIDEADVVIVWNPDGIGEHTQKDIDYARSKGKLVVYTHHEKIICSICGFPLVYHCQACDTHIQIGYAVGEKNGPIEDKSYWEAHCHECDTDWWAHGTWEEVQRAIEHHLKEHPDHNVDQGRIE